jgi:hypothetical protein
MSTALKYLVGTELKSIDSDTSKSVITFDDRSSIVAYAPWHWLFGGSRISDDIEAESLIEKLDSESASDFYVSGVTVVLRSLALSIHLNGRWTLQISPLDPTVVAWVACVASSRIVSAGGGKLTFYQKK